MTQAAAVLARAVSAGLVDATAALQGRVSIHSIGASNLVHRVDRDGVPVAFAKSTGQAAAMDGDDSVARESVVLGLINGLCPARRCCRSATAMTCGSPLCQAPGWPS
ncbi:hypothetical protein G7085_00875 [Tessaracoccus sp. HDW20]|uniref:hypothetical protein n=1 Tax=Tessaracoccus coleopterorum TaxID=2714950 RepID=UPI0018D2E8BB|nr:hypothetical protein [Tessaracoccus coleopterorum]NHB83742.1 hypothetical protein [Tessaracoccus coleopterorum]